MTVTLYGDVLLIINFSMDFLCLYLTSKLLHIKITTLRITVASLLGAVYSLITAYFPGNAYISYIITLAMAPMLVMIAFGRTVTLRRIAASSGIFFASSFLLAGAVSALYSFFSGVMSDSTLFPEYEHGGVILIIALIGAAICALLCRLLTSIGKRRCTTVKIEHGGKSCEISALIDSGNLLREPMTGKAVIIVSLKSVASVLPRDVLQHAKSPNGAIHLTIDSMRRVSVVPASGIGGDKLFVTFRPENIKIVGEDSRMLDALIALDTRDNARYGECEALMPASLAS